MSAIIEQYKKTFIGMQLAIAAATIAIFLTMHHLWVVSATFFAIMQVGAFVGAAWGARLRRRVLQGM